MYLARGEPLGAHCDAFRHILHARGNTQLFSSQSFALWRIAHHRLQAHQILLRKPPDSDQIEWVGKLNKDVPSFHISSDILQMSMLCASARQLSEVAQLQRRGADEIVSEAQRLGRQIKLFLTSLEDWTSKVGEQWRPETVDADRLRQPEDALNSPSVPTPARVLKYADAWLAYMWNCMCSFKLCECKHILLWQITNVPSSSHCEPNCTSRIIVRSHQLRYKHPIPRTKCSRG